MGDGEGEDGERGEGVAPDDHGEDDDQLGGDHHDAGGEAGAVRAELDGEGADSGFGVAFDGFEVVEGHDAVGAEAVEEGDEEDVGAGEGAGEDGGAGEPGDAFVADGDGGIAPPAVEFEAGRRGGIGPGEGQCDEGGAETPWAEGGAEGEGDRGPDDADVEAPLAGHAAGGDGAVGLVDRVHVTVEPVVHRLAGAAHHGAGEEQAGDDLRPVGAERLAG